MIKNIYNLVIALDPGHGLDLLGKGDPGAVDPVNVKQGDKLNTVETVLNWDMTVRTKDALVAKGYKNIFVTRGEHEPTLLHARARRADNAGAFLFVSQHFNACGTPAKGLEAYSAPGSVNGEKLRESILAECLKVYNKKRRHETETFTVLTATDCTAALIEYGFLTDPDEERLANDPAWRQRMAEATADGIDKYIKVIAAA